ncbi:MAG: protein kinase [Blastocatellales bacterium]
MTPERWRQINQVFNEALALPAAERAAFLAHACAGDDEVRRRVEAMLAADAQDDLLVDRPVHEAAAGLISHADFAAMESGTFIGRKIGSYRLLQEIGRGGMGKVYLARDERLDRQVALKLLPASLTGDAGRVARFQREARAASALNHPNILTIYDFGQESGEHYIASEFVEGRMLRSLIGSPELTLNQTLDIIIQVVGALDAAHRARIIHRDIKPENIMLRPDGYVKVLDFGLAKLTETESPTGSSRDTAETKASDNASGFETQTGFVLGTVNYMSPEQARGQKTDNRTDIFSLGVVFYELITGERPFRGRTRNHVLVEILDNDPPPLNLLAEKEDSNAAELQRIISRALAKPPDERYQSAAEMLDDLKRLKQELEFTAKLRGDSAELALRSKDKSEPSAKPSAVESQSKNSHGQAAARATSESFSRFGFLRSRLRLTVFALAVVALMAAGGVFAERWLNGRGAALDSVAVLPFANASGDPQMEYLPDGLTESLIGSLSQLPSLRVMARNTVFTYKGREVDPRQVGGDLNVRAVVTGRVRRQGDRLLIRAELVDATDGARLWGEEYERPLADIPTVEREITREISEALRLRLSGAEQRQIAKRQSDSSEAYRLYLLGRHLYLQHTPAGYEQALAYFNQAIALDPNYALAHAGVSLVYSTISAQILPPAEAMPKARQAALTAIRLDETLPEAHNALALVRSWGDWDWAGAESEYKRAIELNPNFILAITHYCGLLLSQGRFEEALAEARRSQELDPLSFQAHYSLARVYFFARRYEQALSYSRKMVELSPNIATAHAILGLVLSQQGKHEEAISELRRGFDLNRQHSHRAWLAYGYARAGRRDEALKLLRKLESLATRERVSPIYIARIYCGLGDRENALAWLRKAYDERSDHMLIIGVDPAYDPLRSDPRFIEMLRGIGLKP